MKPMIGLITVVLSSLLAFLKNIHFPADAEDTLKRVRNGVLRVGFTNAGPWVYPSDSGARGIEANIVNNFAQSLNAKVEWTEGTEEQLYKALRRSEIDLLVGGITEESPWKKEVGLSKPYLETSLVIGQASTQAANNRQSVEGQTVAVKKGTDEGWYVRKKGGRVYYTTQLPVANTLCAGYEWQLPQWGLNNTGIVLKKEAHVMAAPPGENAFLLTLEKYLLQNKEAIRKQLTR